MKYSLKFLYPTEKLISVRIETTVVEPTTRFYLPKWRPGRYELQNYAQFVSDFRAFTQEGDTLSHSKIATNIWEVVAKPQTPIVLEYFYYANEPDAGGSYFDDQQIYVNGINLFMYRKDLLEEVCELQIELPEGYDIGIGLPPQGDSYLAKDFHELVDSPFLAGNLLHHEFDIQGIKTHLWFQGVCRPDFKRIEKDFRAYSEAQLKMFGDCPVDEYHYFTRMLPYKYRHGVEHQNSTVIVMGPGYELMQPAKYKSFLEICSHELFHTWNVKFLRPVDMYPYDYEGENYSRLHYITEGVTTYYGDLMIWKGKTWGLQDWINSINGELRTHYLKGGKDFISLEDASFNSWTDGYDKEGTPNRKISFYTTGYLVALLTDFEIRKTTEDTHSLDGVIARMYHEIGKSHRGYSQEDYKRIIEEVSGKDFGEFFNEYIASPPNLEPALRELGAYFGLELIRHGYPTWVETFTGIRVEYNQGSAIIEKLLPNSSAIKAGLSLGDELVSLNGIKIEKNLEKLFAFYADAPEWEFYYFHEKQLRKTVISNNRDDYAYIPQFQIKLDVTPEQMARRVAWQRVSSRELTV